MTPSPKQAPARAAKVRKPRRRWKSSLRFVVTAGVISALIVGVVFADGAARGYVADQIETQVRTSLNVPDSTPVKVSVGGTSVLLQLISGSLDHVEVGISQVSLGALAGSAQLSASGIPLDKTKATTLVRIVFTADQTALKSLFSGVPGLTPKSITIGDDQVTLGTEVTLGSFSLPVGIEFSVAAKKGQLQLTPTSIVINKLNFTAKQLKASAFGPLADSLFVSHSICVATLLPEGFSLESVFVTGKSIQLTVAAEHVVLGSASLSKKGTCKSS